MAEWLDLTTVLVGVVVFFGSYVLFQSHREKRRQRLPPGPQGWPLIGHLPSMARDAHLQLTAWQHQYGDVYSIRIGLKKVVVINGYETIREALVRKAAQFSSRPHLFLTDCTNGPDAVVMAPYGEKWRARRKIMLSALRNFGLGRDRFEQDIQDECRQLCHAVAERQGRPFDIHRLLHNAVSNIICSISFNRRFEYDDPKFLLQMQMLDRILQLFQSCQIIDIFPVVRHLPILGNNYKEWQDLVGDGQHRFIKEIVSEHRTTFDPHNLRDAVDAFLYEMNNDENRGVFSGENVWNLLSDLFTAGSESVASTLQWALLWVMVHDDVQKKVCEEIDRVVGRDRWPSLSDKPYMPYTEATLMETMRIRTPIPFAIPHENTVPATLQGYDIPANTYILVNLWSVHMDPANWTDPEKFDPSRFLDDQGQLKSVKTYLPFSTGARVCPGEQLSRTELFLFFTSLLQRFTYRLPDDAPEPNLKGEIGITLAPPSYTLHATER
ncbi:cytochrome P450 2U1-like [Branchiostoma floridae]|uniref:Cytochrome P450 2U1-like n=1 Tax=Branchiostoma floridae TaxID=7739 RepID=C3Y0M2_BRAFL|nr:cytochrome P450 2U1-like [Branchiostoma floridae]|eukprot:XP_002610285.1 hypothetical protein BRAFLDRAFT_115438 [Branchiostoma floridae]